MSKRPRAPRTAPPPSASHSDAAWVNHLGAAVAVLAAAAFAWITRDQVNPDGVAYLDLARAARRGDFASFVQGYWSPLYPVLLALAGASAAAAHGLNAVVVGAGAVLLHRGLVGAGAVAAAAVWAAYLIASLVLVRISAVTPDLLLLVCLVGWWGALWGPSTRRPLLAGAFAGAGFLAKTSLWPWLIVGTAILYWREPGWREGRTIGRYLAPILALMALWVGPMSLEAGRPTFGVTGSLNACWFLRSCDGQTPDTHQGSHAAYAEVPVEGAGTLRVARIDMPPWTYAPWSDPDAWARGIQSQSSTALSPLRYAGIVLTNLWLAVRWSLSYMLAGPLLVLFLAARWSGVRAPWRGVVPPAALLLAGLGIAQFVAVQAVTRTLAPFAFLLVAAAMSRAPEQLTPGRRRVLVLLPFLVAGLAALRVGRFEWQFRAIEGPRLVEVRSFLDRIGPAFGRRTLLVVGPAVALMPSAEQLGARIVGQVMPPSVPQLNALNAAARHAALVALGGGAADVAIELDASGRTRLTVLSR